MLKGNSTSCIGFFGGIYQARVLWHDFSVKLKSFSWCSCSGMVIAVASSEERLPGV